MFKKFLLVFAVAVLAAGYASAQFSFGIKLGLGLTGFSVKEDGKKPEGDEKSKAKFGSSIGVVGEYAFSDAFSIQPGILFGSQGARWKAKEGEVEEKQIMNLNYLQIPLNALYKLDLGGMKLLLQAGPYLGFGLGGQAKWEAKGGGVSESEDWKIKFGDGEEKEDVEYIDKAFDFGLGLGVGLQFSKVQVGLNYGLGLTNMYDNNDFSCKNYSLALSVAYFFGK